jgi:hypothetical protein
MAAPIAAQSKKQKKAIAAANATIEKNLRKHIALLASDSLEGRRTGTAGEEKAVQYLEAYYRQLGIRGLQSDGSFRQPFTIDEGKVPTEQMRCEVNDQPLQWGSDFVALPWSAEKAIEDVAAVALQEQGAPWWYDMADDLETHKNNPHLVPEQLIRDKAKDAAAKGATALLVFNSSIIDDAIKYNGKDRSNAAPIPVLFFTKAAQQRLRIDDKAEFRIKFQVAFRQQTRSGTNVAAFIDNQSPYSIVLGAHFDHLGYGEDGNSRHTGTAEIHNGADDNASGTAAVMELARLLKGKSLPFNIVLLHFSGEELGLYGSKYFVEHPLVDLKTVNYMINLDMVGRLNDSSRALTIGGVGTSPAWPALLQLEAQKEFTIKIDSSGTGPSDHTSFYRKDLPVLFFFTGLHTDYHKPSDDAPLINYKGMVSILHYIMSIIERTKPQDKLPFTKTREQSMGGGRFKVSIGIMPDYTFSGQGVKVDGVIEGRPAQKAGIQAGDVILQLGDHLITSVETYMQALNRFEKGQQTTVTIKRGTEVKEFPITF